MRKRTYNADGSTNNIKKLRLESGYTLEELGKQIGVSAQTMHNFEDGSKKIPEDKPCRLSDIFDVSLDYLLCYEPDIQTVNIAGLDERMQFHIRHIVKTLKQD